MSTKKFYTPRFVKMANVVISNQLNPLVTGKLQTNGQIAPEANQLRDLVLDKERERSHYFDGKLLKAQDLLRDQNYLDARLRQAGRAFGAGIIEGLEASLQDGWVSVKPGSGITPSGLVLELKGHTLRAPVNDAALRQAINKGKYAYLNSGLYLVLLSWHEQTSNEIAEVYPRKASVQPQAQPDSYQQGVKLELMPLQKDVAVNDELLARAQLADEFLQYGAEFPGMPANSLAVALIAVRNNRPLWLDNSLVRRDYRVEREAYAKRLRHREQYQDLLQDLVRRRHLNQSFELNRYFNKVPAMGCLPRSFVDADAQSFNGFPDHYQIDLVPVRADDISFLMAQTAHLPPIDLRSRKSENIQILVPLNETDYEALVAALESEPESNTALTMSDNISSNSIREISNISFASNARLNLAQPFERMLSSRINRRLLLTNLLPSRSAWQKAFDSISSPTGLYYMREFQLASIQAPQVLTISAGFPQAVQPEIPTDNNPTPSPTPTPVPEPTIEDIITARGSINEESKTAIEKLLPLIKKQQKVFSRLFQVMDNSYDRLFWRAMVAVQPADKFLEQFTTEMVNGSRPWELIDKIALDFGLTKAEMKRWTTVARAVGEAV
jgi:hypothetical protein